MGELVPSLMGGPVRSTTAFSAGGLDPDPLWGERSKDFEDEIFTLVNKYRAAKGLSSLLNQIQLKKCAGWKSLHMTNFNYMSHDDPAPPVARSCGGRFADFGYLGSWGENIAFGYTTPESVMSGWLNSLGHRTNIENAAYTAIGIGAAVKMGTDSSWAWTQCFGSRADSPTPPEPNPDPTVVDGILSFSDRHAIGVMWPKEMIPTSRVIIQIMSNNNWKTVREQSNTGETFLTYPMVFSGFGHVRIIGGNIILEDSFTVKRARII